MAARIYFESLERDQCRMSEKKHEQSEKIFEAEKPVKKAKKGKAKKENANDKLKKWLKEL